jgi:hypothetical protein
LSEEYKYKGDDHDDDDDDDDDNPCIKEMITMIIKMISLKICEQHTRKA